MNEAVDVKDFDTQESIALKIKTTILNTQKIMLNSAIEVGRYLMEAKDMVEHGEWGTYLEESVGMSQSKANKYVQIAREYGELSNSDSYTNLSYSSALALLALPEDERKEFVEENNVSDISVEELKAKLKEFAEEKKTLESEKEVISSERDKLESEVKKLSKKEDKYKDKLDNLEKKKDEEVVKAVSKAVEEQKEEIAKEFQGQIKQLEGQVGEAGERANKAEKLLAQSSDENLVKFKMQTGDLQACFWEVKETVEAIEIQNAEQGSNARAAFKKVMEALSNELA